MTHVTHNDFLWLIMTRYGSYDSLWLIRHTMTHMTRYDSYDSQWLIWLMMTHYDSLWLVTTPDHMWPDGMGWPYLTICDQMDLGWPYVTRWTWDDRTWPYETRWTGQCTMLTARNDRKKELELKYLPTFFELPAHCHYLPLLFLCNFNNLGNISCLQRLPASIFCSLLVLSWIIK